MKRKANYILLSIFFGLYLATWLPYFGVVNAPDFVGPFPQPMAFGFTINVINTMIVLAVYFLLFKPYGRRMQDDQERGHDDVTGRSEATSA